MGTRKCRLLTVTAAALLLGVGISQPALAGGGGFVQVCSGGHALCVNGVTFRISGATAYGEYGNPSGEAALANRMNLNVIEDTEFFCAGTVLSDAESSCTMSQLDSFNAGVEAANKYIILNFSQYGQALANAGDNPCTYDWGPYIQFMADHINPGTGLPYSQDPHVAMVELWGEIPAPNYSGNDGCTTATIQTFYSRSLAELAMYFPSTLRSTGGFSYINDPNSGIPWQAVMADPNDQVCSLEINSSYDRDISYPNVVRYCNALATPKPTWIAAWSSCHNSSQYTGDISDYKTQKAGASHATQMLSYAAMADTVGSDFWNMQTDSSGWPLGTCDIGDGSPTIEAAVTAGEG